MKKIIQIREEEKLFTKHDLARLLRISISTLNTMLESGRYNFLDWRGEKFTQTNIEKIFDEQNCISFGESFINIKEWESVVKSAKILTIRNGLFLSKSDEIEVKNLVTKYGIWKAQGLNNHIHLSYYVINNLIQYCKANELIENWIKQSSKLEIDKVIIYLNGTRESTICIYSGENTEEKFLKEFDKFLRVKKMKIREIMISDGNTEKIDERV